MVNVKKIVDRLPERNINHSYLRKFKKNYYLLKTNREPIGR